MCVSVFAFGSLFLDVPGNLNESFFEWKTEHVKVLDVAFVLPTAEPSYSAGVQKTFNCRLEKSLQKEIILLYKKSFPPPNGF